jgi:hypothetical protein
MLTYYCYALGTRDEILCRHEVMAVSHADAIASAWALIEDNAGATSSAARGLEVWLRDVRIFTTARSP